MLTGRRAARRLLLPWTMMVLCAWQIPAAGQSVWELTPYRIQLLLAIQRQADLDPRLVTDLGADVVARADAVLGAAWDLTVVASPPALGRAQIADVEAVTTESLPKQSLEFDKVILLAVRSDADGYRVIARELDVRTQMWSTTVRLPVLQAAKLRDAAFQAVLEAFAPLARIESVDKKHVVLRLRAAALPFRDKGLALVAKGDIFGPVIRYNDRHGNPRRITAIPWTFVTVEKITPRQLECKLYTGMRSPLSARRRGRFEQLALAVTPSAKPTRLVLQSQTDPERLLGGYAVYSHPPDSKTTRLLGLTDRRGSLMIRPEGHPLQVLVIKNGSEPLARLPIVPGSAAEIIAPIPDDDRRLEAEGFIAALQEELIDLVTLREVLLARAKARIKAGKLEEARKLLGELQGLRDRAAFARSLTQQQKRVFSEDRLRQQKIDALFNKTKKLLDTQLDPEAVNRLSRQLRKSGARSMGISNMEQGTSKGE